MTEFRHEPRVFERADEASAREIILTAEGDRSSAERWLLETPYLAALILEDLKLQGAHRPHVIDFGCGVGRLAAPLAAAGCKVLGVDASLSMREMARVAVPGLTVATPHAFALLATREFADGAIAVWALQHALNFGEAVEQLSGALKPGARLVVVNSRRRCVPTDHGWLDDGINVEAELDARFEPVVQRLLDPAAVGDAVAGASFYGVWRKR